MCKFNSGCPGWKTQGDYFYPCTLERGCATSAIMVSLNDAIKIGMTKNQIRNRLHLSDDGKERLLVAAQGDFGDGWVPIMDERNPPSFATWRVIADDWVDCRPIRRELLGEFADRDEAENLAAFSFSFDGKRGRTTHVVMVC